jgi:hypothetical protein
LAAIVPVRVHPGARRNEVLGFCNGVLEVKVAAPPEKGKANKELINFLSELLEVSQSRLTILRGQTSRSKLIAIDGLSQEEVVKRLSG